MLYRRLLNEKNKLKEEYLAAKGKNQIEMRTAKGAYDDDDNDDDNTPSEDDNEEDEDRNANDLYLPSKGD